MNKKISFGLSFIFAGIVIFVITFNFFYIISVIIEFVLYLLTIGAFWIGINQVIMGIKKAHRVNKNKR